MGYSVEWSRNTSTRGSCYHCKRFIDGDYYTVAEDPANRIFCSESCAASIFAELDATKEKEDAYRREVEAAEERAEAARRKVQEEKAAEYQRKLDAAYAKINREMAERNKKIEARELKEASERNFLKEQRKSGVEENGVILSKDRKCAIGLQDGVETAIIPNGVVEISARAFEYNKTLKVMTIPSSVKTIGVSAFKNSSLEQITILPGVTKIGDAAFFFCDQLKAVEIPNTVEELGDSVFWWCKSLKSVVIPESVRSIGERTFQGCDLLESVEIHTPLISTYMFDGCKNLKLVQIGNEVRRINNGAFCDCDSLVTITIPQTVKIIHTEELFSGCEALETVSILGETSDFGKYNNTFSSNCKSLKTITIPATVSHFYTDFFGSTRYGDGNTNIRIVNIVGGKLSRQAKRELREVAPKAKIKENVPYENFGGTTNVSSSVSDNKNNVLENLGSMFGKLKDVTGVVTSNLKENEEVQHAVSETKESFSKVKNEFKNSLKNIFGKK